jgi:hypothetical protein
MIQKTFNVDLLQRGAFLVFSSAELVDAVMGGYLRKPRAERDDFIFLVQHSVKLQEDFGGGILSVFQLAKEFSTSLQDVAVMSNVEHLQKL